MLLVGSKALNMYFKGYRPNAPDSDLICTIAEYEHEVSYFRQQPDFKAAYPVSKDSMVIKCGPHIMEYMIAWPGTTNEELLNYPHTGVASLEILLLLKLSHRYKKNSPHFLKTMRDIQFLQSKGVALSKPMRELLKRREKETYTYAHPNLSQEKSAFFKESDSFYVYDHDDIHRAVAVGDVPAYTRFSMDGQEVRVDKDKWDNLPLHDRLLAGLEESYVLAIERSLVPHPGALTPKQAFDKALEKVCTSITSGWFRKFCYDNYDKIQAMYSPEYVRRFEAALSANKIRKFNG